MLNKQYKYTERFQTTGHKLLCEYLFKNKSKTTTKEEVRQFEYGNYELISCL